jgi:hypothetical protein
MSILPPVRNVSFPILLAPLQSKGSNSSPQSTQKATDSVFPLNEGRDVVDGAYVTTTTHATLSVIVLDQWIHPYKMKFYNYDIALYI